VLAGRRQVGMLQRLGYLERVGGDPGCYRISDADRRALADQQEGQQS
jgi:hypothetical protein